MSISSCPRCARQVTLPQGVSTAAVVRCPLCHAQYALADALLNAPPLLVVVEDDIHEPAGAVAGLNDEIDFDAEIEHDDLAMQEKDTEIEEGGFTAAEPHVGASRDVEPLHLAGPDEESVLDFTSPEADESKPTSGLSAPGELEFEELSAAEPSQETAEEIDLEFDEADSELVGELPIEEKGPDLDLPLAAESQEEIEIDFGDELAPQASTAADTDEMPIEFGEPIEAEGPDAAEAMEIDFEEPMEVKAEGDEIGLDFGEPLDAPAGEAAMPLAEEAAAVEGKKGKKEKAKKEKKPKAPKPPKAAGEGRGRLRSLVGAAVALLIGLPLLQYVLLFLLGPSYDFVGLGKVLPMAVLPASYSKSNRNLASAPQRVTAQLPPQPNDVGGATPDVPNDQANQPPTLPQDAPAPADQPANDSTPPAAETPESASADAAAAVPSSSPPSALDLAATPAERSNTLDDAAALPAAESKPDTAAAVDDLLSDKAAARPADEPAAAEPAEDPAAIAETPGPKDAPEYSLTDLAKAMQAAVAAQQKLNAASNSKDAAKVRSQYYLSWFGLADAITFVKDDAAGEQLDTVRNSFKQLMMTVANDPKRLEAMKFNAARWLGFGKRTTPGIIVAGSVQEVNRVGQLYEVKLGIGLESEAPIVPVLFAVDPQLTVGDQAFAVGSIIEKPADHWAEYQGDEPAIWSGMAFKLQAE